MTIYLPSNPQGWYDGAPPILAIGDSWFWYPKNNILAALEPYLKTEYGKVQLEGFDGAELQEYVGAGKYAGFVSNMLSFSNRMGFNVFLISGSGNDAVDYSLALKSDCTGINTPEDCFDPQGLSDFLRKISCALGALIHEIRWTYQDLPQQDRPIFINGYDYPVPDGRPFTVGAFQVMGPWLQPAMNHALVAQNMDLRKAIMRSLIDKLNDLFDSFAQHNPDVVHIDSRGTLSSGEDYQDDWDNELHPTFSGFTKIVEKHWVPVLRQWGIAN
jgi:hypothetical protein